MKKFIKRISPFVFTSALFALAVNFYVVFSQNEKIVSVEEIPENSKAEYILILGCGIEDGEPSEMLYDRLLQGIELANKNEHMKLVLSGDNSGEHYNEVAVMKNFCIKNGIGEERIICDNKGFSTGESMHNISSYNSDIIIVTQKFHLYRSLFICEKTDINALGVAAKPVKMKFPIYGALREILARNKDFFNYTIFR